MLIYTYVPPNKPLLMIFFFCFFEAENCIFFLNVPLETDNYFHSKKSNENIIILKHGDFVSVSCPLFNNSFSMTPKII